MYQNKTQPTSVTVKLFLDGIVEEEKRVDSGAIQAYGTSYGS